MNTKQFLALFIAVAILNVADGTFEAVVSGLAVHIPLASATAGTLSFPLAVVGVLKLVAAANLYARYAGLKEAEPVYGEPAYGRFARMGRQAYQTYVRNIRSKRSAENNPEAAFLLVSSMDMYSCGKALVCGLQAKDARTLNQDEQLILALFADRKGKHVVNPGSAKAEYDLAAELGLVTRSEVACRQRYNTCPYTADEMMTALRQSQL